MPSALRYAPIPSGIPRMVKPPRVSPANARDLIDAALVEAIMYSGFKRAEFAAADPAMVATIVKPATNL